MAVRPITFLSDYGTDDEFAGVCRAVIARIAPDAQVIDLTHGIRRHDVREGAIALANSLQFAPPGVHLAVVDPGVGTERRPIAVKVAEEDRVLIGPDNGLLSLAWQRLGGPVEAVDLRESKFRLEPASSTFHGRDLFAPVAASLALGNELREAGEAFETDALSALEIPAPRIWPDRIVSHVVRTDRFGNVALNVHHEHLAGGPLRLGEPLAVESAGERVGATFARAFEDVGPGELLLYEDSSRGLALAVNRGSAAELLRLRRDDEVVLRPA
ncbi:MAG TPA: SAM-dependent chlorinase/fluorinase [Solirubrobacterales bacterium]|nr:SAM-dependent chlorinase/fluorinase [Solirubrobacterales bacterium]